MLKALFAIEICTHNLILPYIFKNKERSGPSFQASLSAWILEKNEKYFPCYYSINWTNFIDWLPWSTSWNTGKCVV